jgi:hypothetical protein
MSAQRVEVGVVLIHPCFNSFSSGGRQKEVRPHVLHRLLQAKESHLNRPPAVFDLCPQRFTGHVTRLIDQRSRNLDGFKPSRYRRTPMRKQSLLHGLFPVVRAEVLRLLFTDGSTELYGRELARRSFLAPHTVQDELAKLEAAGLIVSRSNGYHRFFRANAKHPLYGTLRRLVIVGSAHRRVLRPKRSAATRRRFH